MQNGPDGPFYRVKGKVNHLTWPKGFDIHFGIWIFVWCRIKSTVKSQSCNWGLESFSMDDFMPKTTKSGDLRRRLRSSQTTNFWTPMVSEANDIHHPAVGKRVGSHLSILSPDTQFCYWRAIAIILTSSTAQGGGGSFKNRKPIGEIGCCESRIAEQKHWWIELSNCVTD